jgi:hypothetical protein
LSFIAFLIIFNNKEAIIIPSHESGFYLNPFKLVLTAACNTIRYTLDGSSPTNQSKIFQNPLMITGKESYDSLSFINTTIADSIANFGWREPKGEQDMATIVKYAGFKNGSIITDIKTLTFLVNSKLYYNSYPKTKNNITIDYYERMRNKKSLRIYYENIKNNQINRFRTKDSIINTKYKLPVVSLSTDKENLFSNERGVFIAGNYFNPNKIHSGNYFERGIDFERKVHLQYFNKHGKLDFELNLGMRIHGGVTRRNPQKSLKFFERSKYGEGKIRLPFLSKQGVNRLVLESMQESGGGQALIEDIVAQEIVKDIGLEQQNFQAVIVFINGEYWGLHTIRDRIDENYLSYKFNLNKDSFDIIDGNPSTVPAYKTIHGENSDYIDLISFVKDNDLSIDSNYLYIISKIDIDNFID